MELSSRALTTEEEVRSFLRIDSSDNELHEPIAFLIGAVSDAIETATNKKYLVFADTWTADGNGTTTMYLRYKPVITGSPTVTVSFWDGTNWQEVSAIYNITPAVDLKSGKVYFENRYSKFPEGNMNVKFVYSSGYATVSDIPHAIRLAAMKLIGMYLNEARGSRQGMKSETIEGMTTSFDYNKWPNDVKQLLGLRL